MSGSAAAPPSRCRPASVHHLPATLPPVARARLARHQPCGPAAGLEQRKGAALALVAAGSMQERTQCLSAAVGIAQRRATAAAAAATAHRRRPSPQQVGHIVRGRRAVVLLFRHGGPLQATEDAGGEAANAAPKLQREAGQRAGRTTLGLPSTTLPARACSSTLCPLRSGTMRISRPLWSAVTASGEKVAGVAPLPPTAANLARTSASSSSSECLQRGRGGGAAGRRAALEHATRRGVAPTQPCSRPASTALHLLTTTRRIRPAE